MKTTIDALNAIERLEPLPATLQRLVALLGDEDSPLKAVVEIIEHDPAVTANVLKLANSSLFPGRSVDNVRDAVNRLGTVELLNLALSDVVRGMVQPAPIYGLSAKEMWLHAVAAQAAASDLQRRCRGAMVPGLASTAALVHDIGKLVLANAFGTEQTALERHVEDHNVSWVDAERSLAGYDHAQIGGLIAKRWNFPAPLIRAIEAHHEAAHLPSDALIDAVVAADVVARTAGFGVGKSSLLQPYDHDVFPRLGLDVPAFVAACAETTRRVTELRQLFRI